MPASDTENLSTQQFQRDYPLSQLEGIGPKREEALHYLGLEHQIDLLYNYPRDYEDWSEYTPIREMRETGVYTFRAKIASKPYLSRKGKLSWLRLRVFDEDYAVELTYFNQSWLLKKFQLGEEFVFHGEVTVKGQMRTAVNPTFCEPVAARSLGLLPIYSLRKGLTQKVLRKAVEDCFNRGLARRVPDPLPSSLREKVGLVTLEYALAKIHHPSNRGELQLARQRLAFEELFLIKFALQQPESVKNFAAVKAKALKTTDLARASLNNLRAALPFQLTNSQVRAINDILRDLRRDIPMNRLLQGDVGSGKTVVAAFAIAYVVAAGGQVSFMAPTSILAEQHYRSLSKTLKPLSLDIRLLTGATKSQERREILAALASGECDLLIGTHALLEDDLVYDQLILTIVDEQHRFGVVQRAKLGSSEDGLCPHRLLLTATPIPRSFAMIFFSNLDMSIMRELPAGRKPIKTQLVQGQDLPRVYHLMQEEIADGGQAYVICPLIEASEALDLQSAEETARELSTKFPQLKVGLLHGRLSSEEKDAIMRNFVAGEIDILVSTTVVEVGVDNPQATFMLILGAERFGLAQLHQLRGRVGRGERQAYCYLQSDSQSSESLERLNTLVSYTDGFSLAELDLKMRGPGDFFGTAQSGFKAFNLFNVYQDQKLIQEVSDSLQYIESLPEDAKAKAHAQINLALAVRYPELKDGLVL